MIETKIQFSDPELRLMCDAEIILTKNKILEKVKCILEEVQVRMMEAVAGNEEWKNHLIFQKPPKISKGENYLGLPYLILDYPRNFGQNETFAIRTMFWWGRFFSSTLHVSGHYYLPVKETVSNLHSSLAANFYYLNNGDDPWQHHFEEDNFTAVNRMNKEEFMMRLHTRPHIKIAAKWPVNEVHLAANELFKSWEFLLANTGFIHPSGEKDLLPDGPKVGSGL